MLTLSTVRINENGIEMFLGPLEAAILRAMWAGNTSSPKIWRYVREHYATARSEEIAYTTVTSTLHRLADRDIIRRGGDKRRYAYTPTFETEAKFTTACVRKTVWALLHAHAPAMREVFASLAQGEFVDDPTI